MKQNEVFASAVWVSAPESVSERHFWILRRKFNVNGVKKASLRVLGLGFFHCYINGKRVSEDYFLPLNSDFEEREIIPLSEKFTGHRMYVPEFDITDLVEDGVNTIAIHYGGGWYTNPRGCFGSEKAIYRITVETDSAVDEFCSSTSDKIGESFVSSYLLTEHECHDYRGFDTACLGAEFDDSLWSDAIQVSSPDTEYFFSDCPADRLDRILEVTKISDDGDTVLYDCGENTAGYPIIDISGADEGEEIEIHFSEMLEEGDLYWRCAYNQHMKIIADGKTKLVSPMFTWFGFRYFTVKGRGLPKCVHFVHSDVKVTSSFESDNETLNWIYDAFVRTQLCNMHAGIPSDCPHAERLGYTGDGQLLCHTVMNLMDAKNFYAKWIMDISDCQDIYTGHVQYTAPWFPINGGGPGGWGGAIVEVPYQYYKHYGDKKFLVLLYEQMLKYFDYLEDHSKFGFVCRADEKQWCLGDWCAPDFKMTIPPAMVNNYFYVKWLMRMVDIASLVGKKDDIPVFEERIIARKEAIMAAYHDLATDNFISNKQGANVFALDIGLGNERTYSNTVEYYQKLGRYDTGIFGTDILTRILFERGDADLAVDLLTSDDRISFAGMKSMGATTIWENWPDAAWQRSRNHPMFGAVVAYLFDYILGIRQEVGKAGYTDIIVAPTFADKINRILGSRMLPDGEISVSYLKKDGMVFCNITVPENVKAKFIYGDSEIKLVCGKNSFEITL